MIGLWVAVLLLAGCQHFCMMQDSTAPIPESAAIKAVPRTDPGVQPRWALTFVRAKTDGPNASLVFIGDSITEGWEGSGKAVWEGELGKWNPLNLGVGGDQTQHVLWRLQNGQLERLNPKVVVLLIGTNNVGGMNASEIADGINAIVRMIHTKSPETHIIVMKVFPRDEKPGTEWRNKLTEVNRLVAERVHYRNVEFLDINEKLLEPDGTISKATMPDFLHLTPKGYETWAAALKPLLEKYLD